MPLSLSNQLLIYPHMIGQPYSSIDWGIYIYMVLAVIVIWHHFVKRRFVMCPVQRNRSLTSVIMRDFRWCLSNVKVEVRMEYNWYTERNGIKLINWLHIMWRKVYVSNKNRHCSCCKNERCILVLSIYIYMYIFYGIKIYSLPDWV